MNKENPITVEIVSGEDLQWEEICNGFLSTIADILGEACNITPGVGRLDARNPENYTRCVAEVFSFDCPQSVRNR